jgi:hypothetical protein
VDGDLPLTLPTRIVTCAWGEWHIAELLSVTLPALLAPGNLPSVANRVPCEVVILTERASFARVLGDVTVQRIRELCPVRLVEMDDLIPSPDQYGMAITYALHRGFSDLGSAAADVWLIFLNADFVLADGCLRSLIRHLAEGNRLVAAPSYCVTAEDATPELLERLDPASRALSISPREMAGLVLRHRHATVRAKTVNQTAASARYMDQFYWLVDADTLLGHQMPIAIVGMRPERNLPEPNSFWDYGLIREFCPSVDHFVLGDSDDFLMLELRRRDIGKASILTGWPEPREIARNMVLFVTPYTRAMVRHPLTLHAGDLPTGIEEARANLRGFVQGVFAYLPEFIPSHLEHPQFEYHWPSFMESRHRHLSGRLGSITATEEPPPTLTDVDRAWWKLDGCVKAYTESRHELIELRNRQRQIVETLLEEFVRAGRGAADEKLAEALAVIQPDEHTDPPHVSGIVQVPPNAVAVNPLGSSGTGKAPWVKILLDDAEQWGRFLKEARQRRESFGRMLQFIDDAHEERLEILDSDFAVERERRQAEYDRLLRRRARSAAVPYVAMDHGPATPGDGAVEGGRFGLARRVYRYWYGAWPRLRMTHPYWAALRHFIGLVDSAAANGAANVFTVDGAGPVAGALPQRVSGLHARISLPELLNGNFSKAFRSPVKFDLCVCTLARADVAMFWDVARVLVPHMNDGAKILGFCPNFDLQPLSPEEVLSRGVDPSWSVRIHLAGSPMSARVIRCFAAVVPGDGGGRLRRLVRRVQIAATLLALTPWALIANLSEAAAPEGGSSRLPNPCTSMTIEATVSTARHGGPSDVR